MQSENKLNNQKSVPKRTFIEQARRAQIIDATIDVLAEQGYMNTSFVRIAKRAGISASLISYHFQNKEELTTEVYKTILVRRVAQMQGEIVELSTATDKLRIALETDLVYMGTHPKLFRALIEVLFSMRDSKGQLMRMVDADTPGVKALVDILKSGQKNGEFGIFDAYNMALIIDGAREHFLAQLPTRPSLDLELFTKTLVEFALQAVKKEKI